LDVLSGRDKRNLQCNSKSPIIWARRSFPTHDNEERTIDVFRESRSIGMAMIKNLDAAVKLRFRCPLAVLALYVLQCFGGGAVAQTTTPALSYGYNGTFLAGGDGLSKPLAKQDAGAVDAPWSMYAWVWMRGETSGRTLLAGMGDPLAEYSQFFVVRNGQLGFRTGHDNGLQSTASFTPGVWHFIAATFDGETTHLYYDGKEVASGKLIFGAVRPVLQMAPSSIPWSAGTHFAGKIADFTRTEGLLNASQIETLSHTSIDFSLIDFEQGSRIWPVQTRGSVGMSEPQDPATLPRSKAPFSTPRIASAPPADSQLRPVSAHVMAIDGGWKLIAAPKLKASAAAVSRAGLDTHDWMPATVPGTVLTTMIDRGIYPDPDYGLNNMAIPESLNKQDYWYRVEFPSPKSTQDKRVTLTFNGINYAAVVWLNGQRLGTIKGAFIRGTFDVTGKLLAGKENALAVQISPPPHPGIPQEQSIAAGPGPNGGMMCLDGPTFVATEGWDWIPAIRDRDTGIWQDVTLTVTGQVKIGDPQVITSLPLPDTTRADVDIDVPLVNASGEAVHGELTAAFDRTTVAKHLTLPPGETVVHLTPAEFHQLTVSHPRLWWPNGYGKPELYQLNLKFSGDGGESDSRQLHFGIREVSYELSLLDSSGNLRRVEVFPTKAKLRGEQVVDVTHEGMREVPLPLSERAMALKQASAFAARMNPAQAEKVRAYMMQTWVASLLPAADSSPAVRPVQDERAAPYLIIKVNGVRIAARGGNWGMDDMRKRVSRDRLEPYFRLHRDANLNIIRNWVGQNTEQVFYDLADKYGLMVWNDFWDSTQNYNLEPQDPALFLANARDTILRFRNHPSIVMWCGRNEGVPQPILNEGLASLINTLDGTRYYSPSSNRVNLQNSGPYQYQDPVKYFTTLNRGFSVEVGTPSMSTLESFRSTIAPPDQWPISDAWAYHDWHQSGNGDVAPFMAELDAEFGAPTSLPDFERKAQMLNYVDHRAIFEGFNAHLWAPNSGRMLWMTQPAWPSTMWQILSHDYDTQASFYAVKKASEPIHIQLDLSNYRVEVVNTTPEAVQNLTASASVYSLQNKLLAQQSHAIDSAADSLTPGFPMDLAPLLSSGVIFVELQLRNGSDQIVSSNFYWLGSDAASYRQLDDLPQVKLAVSSRMERLDGENQVDVQLKNVAGTAALAVKLTLKNAGNGRRILPAYLTDNYISILPGETKSIQIHYPLQPGTDNPQIGVRGWNVTPETITVSKE
jgi:hypothetical protein